MNAWLQKQLCILNESSLFIRTSKSKCLTILNLQTIVSCLLLAYKVLVLNELEVTLSKSESIYTNKFVRNVA
uniref:Uncharacterized protein n=1 Tax=Setaria italica TaxID=4555 RepID=K3YBE9_SETIT